MQIANGERNLAGGNPVGDTSTEIKTGPANEPDWTHSEWYRIWVELAERPHEQ